MRDRVEGDFEPLRRGAGNMGRKALLLVMCLGVAVALVLSTGVNVSAGYSVSDKAELARIEQAIRASIGWAKDKNLELLYGTIANDSNFLEVHPEGRVVKGFEEFRKAERIWMSPNFKAVRYEIRDLRIKLSKSGDVAWFFCILDDINEWKGQPANWENTRWTGVLEKREGRWRMVQQHFSFAEDDNAPQSTGSAAQPSGAASQQTIATSQPSGAVSPILFYSGRNNNKDVYILYPGEKEPRNLTNNPAQDLCPAASPDGNRILFLSDRGGATDIYSMAVDGSDVRRLTATPEIEEHPEYTPDGKRILFVRDFEKRTEIWIMNADGTGAGRLTANECRDERPFMSSDGTRIVFMSNRDGNYEIYTMAPDGGAQTRLTRTAEWEIFPVWSPDGTKIAYSQKFRADGRMQGMIRVMNADGTGDHAITGVETRDENVMWCPGSRFILFQSVRDGNFEVYQANADGSDPIRMTDHPAWDGWACYLRIAKE
jgi:TolB protein